MMNIASSLNLWLLNILTKNGMREKLHKITTFSKFRYLVLKSLQQNFNLNCASQSI